MPHVLKHFPNRRHSEKVRIAKWLKGIAYQVRDLVREYGIERFRKMVLAWADERSKAPRVSPSRVAGPPPIVRRDPVAYPCYGPTAMDEKGRYTPSPRLIPTIEMTNAPDSPLLGMAEGKPEDDDDGERKERSWPEKYAILSAIHDVLAGEVEQINPFGTTRNVEPKTIEDLENAPPGALKEYMCVEKTGVAYWAMMREVKDGLPCAEDWEGYCHAELKAILKDVKEDLAESAHTVLSSPAATVSAMPPCVVNNKPDKNDNAIPRRARVAGQQYRVALAKLTQDGIPKPLDREAHDWVRGKLQQIGRDAKLPVFASWQRNLREYRRLTGAQKNTPRSGRGKNSGAFAGVNEIEAEDLPDSIRPHLPDS